MILSVKVYIADNVLANHANYMVTNKVHNVSTQSQN